MAIAKSGKITRTGLCLKCHKKKLLSSYGKSEKDAYDLDLICAGYCSKCLKKMKR